MDILRGDFETRGVVDLPQRGVNIYAAHPDTDALCLGYAFNDEPVEIWIKGEPCPARIKKHIEAGGLFSAWNAHFELAIWNEIMTKRHGWPPLDVRQCRCSMMMAAAMSLPLALDKAAQALNLKTTKDMSGHRLMMQMSRPRKLNPLTWWEDGPRKQKLYAYCKQDVETERAAGAKLRVLRPSEAALWVLDYEINQRGVPVDLKNVRFMSEWCDNERVRLDKEMRRVTKQQVSSCSDLRGLKAFAGVESVAKAPLHKAIERSEGRVLAALSLRRDFAKTSTKKLDAFDRGTMEDGYMRGIFQMYGAESTGRWAGRRVQPQNFPRPTCGQEEIERRIDKHDPGSLAGAADCLRGMIAAPKGQKLVAGDFSSVEARGLAWMAGQENKLKLFRKGADVYVHAAADIYGHTVEITKERRQVGKVAELALGYQGAKGAFNAMATGYGVQMKDAQVEAIVKNWRKANSNIVDWWYDLDRAATKAINKPGDTVTIGRTIFKHTKGHLWLKLPSGRSLCFPKGRIGSVDKPWGREKGIIYRGENSFTHKVEWLSTYGGKIAENIVQALCRDLLAEAMVRVEAAGYRVVMHVHDEIVAMLHDGGSLKEFEEIMAEVPAWADGLPIGAEGWTGRRYRK